jgi:hypothetical protein
LCEQEEEDGEQESYIKLKRECVDVEGDMVTYRFHLKKVDEDIDDTRFSRLFKSEGKVHIRFNIDDEGIDHVKKVWFYAEDFFKFGTNLVVIL